MVKELQKKRNSKLFKYCPDLQPYEFCNFPMQGKKLFPTPAFFEKYPEIELQMFVIEEDHDIFFHPGAYHFGGNFY